MGSLAMVMMKLKKTDDAEKLLKEALDLARKALGDSHKLTLAVLNNLGVLYSESGRLAETEALYREVVRTKQSTAGEDDLSTATSKYNLGLLLSRLNKLDEAAGLLKGFERGATRRADARDTLLAQVSYGQVLVKQDKLTVGEEVLMEAFSTAKATYGETAEMTAKAAAELATAKKKRGHDSEAQRLQELVKKVEVLHRLAPSAQR